MAGTIYLDLLDAAETRLRGLSLDGVEKRVIRHTLLDAPWLAGRAQFPMIGVSPFGFESTTGGTNSRRDKALPLVVRVLDRWPPENEERLNQWLKWRMLIDDAFDGERLGEAYTVENTGGPVVEGFQGQDGQWFLHSLPLFYTMRHRRTAGA